MFIDFEVGVEADIEENDEVRDNSDLGFFSSLIDNEERDNNVSFYRSFKNVEANIDATLKNEYGKGLQDIEILMNFLIYMKVQKRNQKFTILIIQQKKQKTLVRVYYQNLI